MNFDKEIITVRPSETIDTIQKLPNYVSVSGKTAGATGISMNVVIISPSAKAEPHFHNGYETAIYLLKGNVQTFYGKNLSKSVINQQGDFIFIPEGVPQALVQCNCEAETLTRQGINREHEVEAVLPKLALFAEYQERQQELVES